MKNCTFIFVLLAAIFLSFAAGDHAWAQTAVSLATPEVLQAEAAKIDTAKAETTAAELKDPTKDPTKDPSKVPAQDLMNARLIELEARYFGHSYAQEPVEKRLRRLENLIFGQVSSDHAPLRLHKIEQALAKSGNQKKTDLAKLPPLSLPVPKKQGKAKKLTFNQTYAIAAQDIKLKRYHAAADGLLKVINMNPRYSPAYAYLGDVLIKLKDYEGAKEAYRAGFEVDPFGQYGRYGKARLMGMAADEGYRRTQPQDTPIVVERTLKLINKQSNDLGNRYATEGQTWSRWRTDLANIQLRRLAQDSHSQVQVLRRRGYQLYNDNEMSNLESLRTSYLRNDAVVQGTRARAEATRKAAFVAQSASNLKSLMMQPTRPGNAKLRALGTNLYVRYYGNETPSWTESPVPEDPAIELAAKANKLK